MKVLVCGGRDYKKVVKVYSVLDELEGWYGPIEIITGMARGADMHAYSWASDRGRVIHEYPALWSRHGKAAGPIRNQKMLKEGQPDIVVAFPGGKGTAHMVKLTQRAGVKLWRIEDE